MLSLIFSITLLVISLTPSNFISAINDINSPRTKPSVLSEMATKEQIVQETTAPTPTLIAITNTPTAKPTKVVVKKVEIKLFDVQWEFNGMPYLCYSYAIPELKAFEPKVVEVTRAYRECDATPIEEAIEKGYVCKAVCPPEGHKCGTVCPESAYRHLEECQAPAKATWDKWNAMRDKYCTTIIK